MAVPLLVMISTGLLLQAKKHWTWVQPAEVRGTGSVPAIGLEELLASVKSVPELNVTGWTDVNRLDVRPSRGMVKVWLNSGWEVQVDLGTGRVLQTAYRRSDLIESIHDGSSSAATGPSSGCFCRPASSCSCYGSAVCGCGGFRSSPSAATAHAESRNNPVPKNGRARNFCATITCRAVPIFGLTSVERRQLRRSGAGDSICRRGRRTCWRSR